MELLTAHKNNRGIGCRNNKERFMNKKLKFALFLALFMVLSGVIYAQVEVKTMLEGAFLPFQFYGLPDDADFGGDEPGYYPNGETGAIRAGFGRSDAIGSFQAGVDFITQTPSQNLGAQLQVRFRPTESNIFGIGDNLRAWWKPIDMLQVDVGKYLETSIRSKVIPPPYYHFYLPAGNDNMIFQQTNGIGLLFRLTPLPQLYVSAAVKADENLGLTNNTDGYIVNRPLVGQEEARYMFERTQAAAAYTFGDIGQFRVQYFGRNASVRDDENGINNQIGKQALNSDIFGIQAHRVEAAFNLTMLPNLTLDIGGKIPLLLIDIRKPTAIGGEPIEINGKFQEPYMLSLGAKYLFGNFSFNGLFSGKLGGWLQYEETSVNNGGKWEIGPELQAIVWVNYRVIENLQLEVDFGTILNGDTFYDEKLAIKGGMLFGGGIFGQLNIHGNSNWLRAGVSFSTGTLSGTFPTASFPGNNPAEAKPSPDQWFNIISVPIVFHLGLPL
jgi:hypothetical protein